MDIGKRVLDLMDKLSVSRQSFAEKIDISVAVLSHISSGRNKPGLEMIQRILKEYPQVSTDWLLLGTGPMFREKPAVLDTKDLEDKIYTLRLILKDHGQAVENRLQDISSLINKHKS